MYTKESSYTPFVNGLVVFSQLFLRLSAVKFIYEPYNRVELTPVPVRVSIVCDKFKFSVFAPDKFNVLKKIKTFYLSEPIHMQFQALIAIGAGLRY